MTGWLVFNNIIEFNPMPYSCTLTLTYDFETPKPWYLTWLVEYPKIISCTKFEYFGIIRFWVMIRANKWKMQLLTFTFELLSSPNHNTSRISKGHSLYQVWTLWDHSFFSYTADKQTDSNAVLTLTVGEGYMPIEWRLWQCDRLRQWLQYNNIKI